MQKMCIMMVPTTTMNKVWKECPTCHAIPDSSSEFWKGGESDSTGMPAETMKLEIIGFPYFTDSTSGSNSCIKRCPTCKSVFRWANEYTYLVNGSEDDISLVRLGIDEGEKAVEHAWKQMQDARRYYQEQGMIHVQLLASNPSNKAMEDAAGFFDHYQIVYKEDISFAIPALVKALAAHEHKTPTCLAGQRAFFAIRAYAKKTKDNARRVTDAITALETSSRPPEIVDLTSQLTR
jgi:hypothetical protein